MVTESPIVNYPCENMPHACSLDVPSQVAFPFPVKHALFPSAVLITPLVVSMAAARVKSVERRLRVAWNKLGDVVTDQASYLRHNARTSEVQLRKSL